MLTAIIVLGILRLTSKNQRAIKQRITNDATNQVSYLKAHMGLSTSQVKHVKRAVSVITEPKNVETWSDRLWVNSDTLANDVENLVTKHVRHGMDLDDMGALLESHVNKNQFRPGQSIADRTKQIDYATQRIVRTESARIIDEANMTTYKMLGIDSVDWIAEPGACTTGVNCSAIAAGSPYSLDEVPRIPADTHPQCRCSKIPHEGGSLVLQAAGSVTAVTFADKAFTDSDKQEAVPGTNSNHDVMQRKSGAVENNGFEPELPEEVTAKKLYQEFSNRKVGPQIEQIAKNTGYSSKMIKRVYDHIFINKHKFASRPDSKFDPSYEMAQSWSNLLKKNGKEIYHSDIVMLNHELFESILMNHDGLDYETAHAKTNRVYNYAKELKKEGRLRG